VPGPDFLAALPAKALRGALPPVLLRAVCFERAILLVRVGACRLYAVWRFRVIRVYFVIFNDILRFLKIFKDIQKYSRIFKYFQEFVGIFRCIHVFGLDK